MARARSRSAAASSIRLKLKLATPALAIAHAGLLLVTQGAPPVAHRLQAGPGPRRVAEHPRPGRWRDPAGWPWTGRRGRRRRGPGSGRAASSSPASSCRRARSRRVDGRRDPSVTARSSSRSGVRQAGFPHELLAQVGQGVGGLAGDRRVVGEVVGGPVEVAGPLLRPADQRRPPDGAARPGRGGASVS